MINIFVCIFVATCHFFVVNSGILFLHCFYDTGFCWHRKRVLPLIVFAILYCTIGCLSGTTLLGIILPEIIGVAETAIILFDYKGKKWKGFLRYALYWLMAKWLVFTYSELISYCVLPYDIEYFFTQNWENEALLIANILGTVFFGAVFPCLYNLYKKDVVMRCGKREIWKWILVLIFGVVLGSIIVAGKIHGSDILFYPLAIVTILLVSLFSIFIYASRVSQFYRKRTAVQEDHIQAELKNFQQYQQMQEETARFRHDIRNNLLCISDMLEQGKMDEAEQYLKDLLEITKRSTKRYVTGDEMLDSIIGVKAELMEKSNIRFELDGVLAGGLPWKPMDICNVFANALDNAIEACQKVEPEKRRITMSVKSTPQFWFVAIENAAAKKIDVSKIFQKNAGYTSKSNVAKHGLGTYNMKHTVESNGAMLKAESTDEIFKLEIIINKSSPE